MDYHLYSMTIHPTKQQWYITIKQKHKFVNSSLKHLPSLIKSTSTIRKQ